MARLVNVSNRLPVRFAPGGTITRSSGGLASALAAVAEDREMLWIGWPGREEPDPDSRHRRAERLREDHGLLPVELTTGEVDRYYAGYSNASLWPLLHYMVPREVFRCLPEREEIVRGLPGADLIGFHTFGYLRHFRSSLLRLPGVESEPGHLEVDGRPVRLSVHPIGHDRAGVAAFERPPAQVLEERPRSCCNGH